MEKQQKIKHLLWRTGFGPTQKDIERLLPMNETQWWSQIKSDSRRNPEYFDVVKNAFDGIAKGFGELGRMENDRLDKEQKKQIRKKSREGLRNLNLIWLEEMANSRAQLREKNGLLLAWAFCQSQHQYALPTTAAPHHSKKMRWAISVRSCGRCPKAPLCLRFLTISKTAKKVRTKTLPAR